MTHKSATLVPYEVAPEKILLADLEPEEQSKRLRARAACASSVGKWAWMSVDLCVARRAGVSPPKLVSSKTVVAFLEELFPSSRGVQEHFLTVCLNNHNVPLGVAIQTGGLSSVAVDVAVVLKPALLLPANAVIIAHNHPSGDPTPSAEDIQLTERLQGAAELLGLRLLDHVILTERGGSYHSMLDSGLLVHGRRRTVVQR
jgi:DNA repair protein RadC